MSEAATLLLGAPLSGWSTPLEEVPDEVFATRMLGDGLAIDPTGNTLHAPCDGEVVQIAAAHHAITLRAAGGCEILMHVGIDTVALKGAGFTPRIAHGARVRSGDALLSFDLDFLARHARSVLTPIIITAESGFKITRSTLGRALQCGELLLELTPAARAGAPRTATEAPDHVRQVRVTLEHGIHARPAALIAHALKPLAADVRVRAHERTANARSTIALMGLGVQHGTTVQLSASGPDALNALALLARTLGEGAAAPALSRHAPIPPPVVNPVATAAPGDFAGVISSRGLAVGALVQLRRTEPVVAESGAGVPEESAALDEARARVRRRLKRAAGAGSGAAPPAQQIAAAHLELLDDPQLLAAARALIGAGRSAGFSWRSAVREQVAVLSALEDARLRERVDDLLDLEAQVLHALGGSAEAPPTHLPADAILVARELLPSQLLALDASRVAGIGMAAGGATSHAAILAGAMGIPSLVALGAEVLRLPEGGTVILDAQRGLLEAQPTPERLAAVRAELATRRAQRAQAQQAAQSPARTAEGTRIIVLANVGSVAEARAAVSNGAEGCGLLRTEFLFLERREAPSEAEQTAAYRAIAEALEGRPLTLRTLDAGGDKPLAYLPLPKEENPALGLRGVRTSLAYPHLLRTQLRAVLAVREPQLRLLLPMITDASEVYAVRALLEELRREMPEAPPLPLGVMIETPAAAVLAEPLAAEADFLSIGTNDLTQYTLAMDRGHAQLAPRVDALHPAVLTLIARSAQGAHAHGRHAAVCGGLASEPAAAPLLVGLGIDELSALPAVIPEVKARLRQVTLTHCRALAERALRLPSAAAVRALLELPVALGGD